MRYIVIFTMLMGVLACNKENVELKQIEITKLTYTVEIHNLCTSTYNVKNEYFDVIITPQESKILTIKETYDNIKGFYINYKDVNNTYINQYKPTRNDKTKVFKMNIGGVATCQ